MQKRKKAQLLHSTGIDVHEIFATLSDPGQPFGGTDSSNMYERAPRTLNSYSAPQVNIPYERQKFRQMHQEDSETVDQEDRNEQIRDQVIDKCQSSKLRKKFLEKGQDLTLEKVPHFRRHENTSSCVT